MVKVQIQPKVTISQGKGVKGSLNWGKIEALNSLQTALWPATAADNAVGRVAKHRGRHRRVR
jgi:hypothetical protein